MTTYRAAPEIAHIADAIIREHHSRLDSIRIEYVWRDKAASKNGRTVGATARKVSGLNAFMAREVTSAVESDEGDSFFVIEVAEDVWGALSVRARKALIDHELCHCAVEYDQAKEEWKLSIRGHDVEEFTEIVERYGAWDDDLLKFAEAIKTQGSLFDVDDEDGDE